MCRYRVSLFQAKHLAMRCRNLVWHERPLTESDSVQLLDALEDMISAIETRRLKSWRRRWTLALRMDVGVRRWMRSPGFPSEELPESSAAAPRDQAAAASPPPA